MLTRAPAKIEMVFKSPTRLIKLEIRKVKVEEADSLLSSLFGSKAGNHSYIAKADLTRIPERHTIPLLHLYRVHWRALVEDGHMIKEDFSFEVLGD